MNFQEFMVVFLTALALTIIYFVIPFRILRAITFGIIKTIKKRKSAKRRANIIRPVWNKITTKEGDIHYKFAGYSNYDTKAKWLPFSQKDILDEAELTCWNILRANCQTNGITICPKVQIKEFISIDANNGTQNNLINKINEMHIDFLLCDSSMNIIAGIEINKKPEKFIDDVFFNIRIPLFWIIPNNGSYHTQIEQIFKELSAVIIDTNNQQNKAVSGRFSRGNIEDL